MRRVSTRALVMTGLVLTLLLAGVVSFYASSHPDGLSYVAEKVGIAGTAKPHTSDGSPLAGYTTRGVSDQRMSRGVAGVTGVVVVGLVFGGLTWALRRRRTGDDTAPDGLNTAPDTASENSPAAADRERDGSSSVGR